MFMFALHNEPLLDKRIFDWLKHIKSGNSRCYSILPTNGELLDAFSLTEIEASGVDQININLGARTRETYERIYAGLDYERVVKNVNRLLADEAMKRRVQIMFTLNKYNAHEAGRALNYWKQLGVRVKVIVLNNRAGCLDGYDSLSPKNDPHARPPLLRGWKMIMSGARKTVGCELPFYQMNILFNGDVIICSCDWKRATVPGNINSNSLREIWNCDRINKIRRLILRKKYDRIGSCAGCSQAQ